jgi:hypothetical protein
MARIQPCGPGRIKQASARSAVLGLALIFAGMSSLPERGETIVAIGLDLRSNARGFKDGPAKSFPFQITALPQGMALILKLAAFFDGELGAGEQVIGHAAIPP